MELRHTIQPPYQTSLIGTLHGAAQALGVELATADLFGMSGQGFLMNVHERLCPSGPYCFDPAGIHTLVRNIGLSITSLGFFDSDSSMDERARIEADLRDNLSQGIPCGVLNMDHQLIVGYDETGLLLAQPWGEVETTPPRLSFKTWSEFKDELHVDFYSISRCDPLDLRESTIAALSFAIDLYREPETYAADGYGIGPDAWKNWIGAVTAGHGNGHGAWWNGMVWGECHAQASNWLSTIGDRYPVAHANARKAAIAYARIGELLVSSADRELASQRKLELIEEARDTERRAIEQFPELIDLLETG